MTYGLILLPNWFVVTVPRQLNISGLNEFSCSKQSIILFHNDDSRMSKKRSDDNDKHRFCFNILVQESSDELLFAASWYRCTK